MLAALYQQIVSASVKAAFSQTRSQEKDWHC